MASWREADALCDEPPKHYRGALRAAFQAAAAAAPPGSAKRPAQLPPREALQGYACQVVAAVDTTADECPAMLPLLAEARGVTLWV